MQAKSPFFSPFKDNPADFLPVKMWSFGQGHFGHFRFRERGYLLTIYININIYIIVAVLTASVFDFDQMTMTKNDRVYKNYIFFLKYS
jgi:hypothetical protein